MKALIVDDERLARAELRRLLAAHPAIEIAGEAVNAADARQKIEELSPELLFLDIEMPGESAFDLLASLDSPPEVIFTTAFDAHAVRAFSVSALDYVLKPIEPARLAIAIEKALAAHRARRTQPPLDRIFVRDGDRVWFVRLEDVAVIESEGNYARLDVPGHPLVARSLSYLETRLEPAFFRASRKHLVSLKHVEKIDADGTGGLVLTMRGGVEVEMSRRQAQKFKAKMSL